MGKPERWAFGLLDKLMELPDEDRQRLLARMPPPAFRTLDEEWFWQAHQGQRMPAGEWPVGLIMAGRGFGKTRAGAEWVWERARETPAARIALVGATLDDVAKVMVAGPSGLIAEAGTGESAIWLASKRTLEFSTGAVAFAYSAERPGGLRGPEHHFAWCDELAKWRHGDETWDNLMMGLRCGERPQVLVTTTPRPVPLIRRIRAIDGKAETNGRMADNVHLAETVRRQRQLAYGGTRLGRQELDGVLLEEVEGALWPRELIERSRVAPFDPAEAEDDFRRVVVGVDPPATAAGTCGISVCGRAADGDSLYVLADWSVAGASPEGWAREVARAAEHWDADRVVAEANNGGDMVASVLRGAAPWLPVRLVNASRGKIARAEPVAAAFERGAAKLAGRFPELEDELAGMTIGGLGEGMRSPDRADALVWAMTELLKPAPAEPRIRQL